MSNYINKYGGTNDMPIDWQCNPLNKEIYNLWYGMLRRCYDEKQLSRSRGSSYRDCTVCEEWKKLSNFVCEVKDLPGYSQWVTAYDMELDKDILGQGSKEYNRKNCCFVPASVNKAYANRMNPNITHNANESNKTRYALLRNGKWLVFESEKDACKYLGVAQCSVASCYRRHRKCKGYVIERCAKKVEG